MKLVVSGAALLLLGVSVAVVTAVTQSTPPPVTRVPVCVKGNGQLRVVIDDKTSCGPSERQMDWVVGGQVTDIQLGQGLVGRRDDGIVKLALDPSIIEGANNPGGRIFAGFDDGPRELADSPFGSVDLPQIAKLDLPAGDYAIFAKLQVTASELEDASFTRKESVSCQLVAENDFDRSSALLEVQDDRPILAFQNDRVVLTLEVVHRFTQPGEVVLKCAKVFAGSSTIMEMRNLKIIAIEGSGISNVFLGN